MVNVSSVRKTKNTWYAEWYDSTEEAVRIETEVRQGNNLPANEEYTMVRGPDHRMNPNAFIWIRSAPLGRIADLQGPQRERDNSKETS